MRTMRKNRKKYEKQKGSNKGIHVDNFPTDVWNRFGGKCKALGRNIPDVLEEILSDWMKHQTRIGN